MTQCSLLVLSILSKMFSSILGKTARYCGSYKGHIKDGENVLDLDSNTSYICGIYPPRMANFIEYKLCYSEGDFFNTSWNRILICSHLVEYKLQLNKVCTQ